MRFRPFGFSWGPDNQIVFGRQEDSGLSRVSADGGQPETLTTPDKSKSEYAHHLPYCLPAGRGILFTITRDPWDMQPRVAVLDLATRKWRHVAGRCCGCSLCSHWPSGFSPAGYVDGGPFLIQANSRSLASPFRWLRTSHRRLIRGPLFLRVPLASSVSPLQDH